MSAFWWGPEYGVVLQQLGLVSAVRQLGGIRELIQTHDGFAAKWFIYMARFMPAKLNVGAGRWGHFLIRRFGQGRKWVVGSQPYKNFDSTSLTR
jgi:hypothetical protein